MNNKLCSSIRNTSLFQLYDIENDLRRHKQKINQIKNKKAKDKVKKQYSTQLNVVNELRKNWITGQISKTLQKQKQIFEQNKVLYNQILKVRKRPFDRHKILSQPNILSRSHIRSSHSVNLQNSQRRIQSDNEKLMQKILTAKSPLNKIKMKAEYRKVKQVKKRLESCSFLNKTRMRTTLEQLNIKPSIYLPDIAVSPKVKTSNDQSIIRSLNADNLQNPDNKFLNLSRKEESQRKQPKSFMLPKRLKQISQKVNLTHTSQSRQKNKSFSQIL